MLSIYVHLWNFQVKRKEALDWDSYKMRIFVSFDTRWYWWVIFLVNSVPMQRDLCCKPLLQAFGYCTTFFLLFTRMPIPSSHINYLMNDETKIISMVGIVVHFNFKSISESSHRGGFYLMVIPPLPPTQINAWKSLSNVIKIWWDWSCCMTIARCKKTLLLAT